LVRKYHPDANFGDRLAEKRFKEIQHAYEILSNSERRREYDRKLRASSERSMLPLASEPLTGVLNRELDLSRLPVALRNLGMGAIELRERVVESASEVVNNVA
jgi:curved DNA-binding protein CbpA